MRLPNGPIHWPAIQVVIFDMDGTLYSQAKLRALMSMRLAMHTLRTRNLETVRVLRAFRTTRRGLSNSPDTEFLVEQYRRTAVHCACEPEEVQEIVEHWMHSKSLSSLKVCMFPGVRNLFDGLRQHHKRIAVFSDFPAALKLEVLGLQVDWVVSSEDPDVARLKPNSAGFGKILELSKASSEQCIAIGNRVDHDWAAAKELGIRCLVKSILPIANVDTFSSYTDRIFEAVSLA